MADVVENDEALLKLIKKLPPGFQVEADAMDEKKLRDEIVKSAHNAETTIAEEKEKDSYKKAKVAWSDANITIKETKAFHKARTSYCLHLLEQKGNI
jgi:hypothetical protein